ncbi:MAG: hypothetical protein GY771_01400 [bacterium]|nr:hypothetical protein [bacterium]
MKKLTWFILVFLAVVSLALFGCGPKETDEEATEEATEDTTDETEEATEDEAAVDIEEMTAEIKTVVEEANDYMSTHNMGNTDKAELSKAYFGYVEKFEELKTVYSVSTPTDKQKEGFDKLVGVLDNAIDAMSKYSEGAKATGMDGMKISMEAATKWQEVNKFFGIELE